MSGETNQGESGVDKRASARMPEEESAASPPSPEASSPLAKDAEPAEAPAEESQDVETLTARLEEERKKAESYLASWQRAAADYQNLKRRVEKEREDYGRLATAAIIINFLPILDDLERALQGIDVHLAGLTWVDGVWLIYRKFQAALEAAGVVEIKADGEAFDPNLHEAVMYGEGEEGKVVSVVQKGYTLGDRVLRPTMVVVGKPSGPSAGKEEAGGETPEAGDEKRDGGKQGDLTG